MTHYSRLKGRRLCLVQDKLDVKRTRCSQGKKRRRFLLLSLRRMKPHSKEPAMASKRLRKEQQEAARAIKMDEQRRRHWTAVRDARIYAQARMQRHQEAQFLNLLAQAAMFENDHQQAVELGVAVNGHEAAAGNGGHVAGGEAGHAPGAGNGRAAEGIGHAAGVGNGRGARGGVVPVDGGLWRAAVEGVGRAAAERIGRAAGARNGRGAGGGVEPVDGRLGRAAAEGVGRAAGARNGRGAGGGVEPIDGGLGHAAGLRRGANGRLLRAAGQEHAVDGGVGRADGVAGVGVVGHFD